MFFGIFFSKDRGPGRIDVDFNPVCDSDFGSLKHSVELGQFARERDDEVAEFVNVVANVLFKLIGFNIVGNIGSLLWTFEAASAAEEWNTFLDFMISKVVQDSGRKVPGDDKVKNSKLSGLVDLCVDRRGE